VWRCCQACLSVFLTLPYTGLKGHLLCFRTRRDPVKWLGCCPCPLHRLDPGPCRPRVSVPGITTHPRLPPHCGIHWAARCREDLSLGTQGRASHLAPFSQQRQGQVALPLGGQAGPVPIPAASAWAPSAGLDLFPYTRWSWTAAAQCWTPGAQSHIPRCLAHPAFCHLHFRKSRTLCPHLPPASLILPDPVCRSVGLGPSAALREGGDDDGD
jgi:hypothetical protein